MNQILVTEKIYVTPELKRKKKIYKILFMISVFAAICLCSVCIYAEYDRNKDSGISESILSSLITDDTIVSEKENALIVQITQKIAENIEEYENQPEEKPLQMAQATATYKAANGKEYSYIGRIVIPKISVDYVILDHTTDELLKVAPCKFHGSNPNEVGNLCIAGHNYRNKRFFSKVPTLVVGDIVQITDLSGRTIDYEVYDVHTVDPENRDDTTQKTGGRKEVTLITCTNDSKQRVIVKCKEKI